MRKLTAGMVSLLILLSFNACNDSTDKTEPRKDKIESHEDKMKIKNLAFALGKKYGREEGLKVGPFQISYEEAQNNLQKRCKEYNEKTLNSEYFYNTCNKRGRKAIKGSIR